MMSNTLSSYYWWCSSFRMNCAENNKKNVLENHLSIP